MPDTTIQTLEMLTRASERARQKHTEEECQAAMKSGENGCLEAKAKGLPVFLMDEARMFMSDLDFAYAVGWNSKVFCDEPPSE